MSETKSENRRIEAVIQVEETEEDGLLGNDIYVIEKGMNNQIWIGTDGGINICSFWDGTKHIESLTKANGLPDDIVHAIYPDQKGNFWIGMYDYGVCKYNTITESIDFVLPDWQNGIVNCIELFDSW